MITNGLHFRLVAGEGENFITVGLIDPVAFKSDCSQMGNKWLLERSIEKWEFIAELMAFNVKIEGDGGRFTCALCNLYNADNLPYQSRVGNCQPVLTCVDCPVYHTTGAKGCHGTAYNDFCLSDVDDLTERLLCANREVGFLKGILRHYNTGSYGE